MVEASFDPEAIIDALAPLIGIEVPAEYRPGIAASLAVTARFAALVMEFPLGDHAEPATVFTP